MSRATEIAKLQGCTVQNVYLLLRTRKIEGTRTASGWVVSDQALREYLNRPKPNLYLVKNLLYNG